MTATRLDVIRAKVTEAVERLEQWKEDGTLNKLAEFIGVPVETLTAENLGDDLFWLIDQAQQLEDTQTAAG